MRLEEQERRRRDRPELARDPGAARELSRADRRLGGDPVVGVERILPRVPEHHVRLDVAHHVRQLGDSPPRRCSSG